MNTHRRVVITGMGVITPIGNDVETFWRNLQNGVSGIDCITSFDTSAYDCRIAGEVRDFEPKNFFNNPKDVRRADRYTHLAMAAAKMAMQDSGVDLEKVNRHRFGAIISSGIGGLKTLEDQHSALLNKGPSRVSAFTIPMLISNMASGLISMEFGLQGPNFCIVTACATSNNAIGESWRIIKFGDADIFLAGGAEASIIPIGLAGFSSMKALSTRNDEPQRASRPFDRDRDGVVMGAGAVETASCALSIRDGVIPPTINLENPDPECDLDYTANTAKQKKVRIAVNNSFGFGGHNATLVVAEYTGS